MSEKVVQFGGIFMSSYVDYSGPNVGILVATAAAAAAIPVAGLLGAGWLAWQGGKLLVSAGALTVMAVEDKKEELAEREERKRKAALENRRQLAATCEGILASMEQEAADGDSLVMAEMEKVKEALRAILSENIPGDTERLEGMNLAGFLRLDEILSRQKRIREMQVMVESFQSGERMEVGQMMEDLRNSLMAVNIREIVGKNVCAVDGEAWEKKELTERFQAVVGRVMEALGHVEFLAQKYGLPDPADRWFRSCFNGVDADIQKLSAQGIPNDEFKKGIRRLEARLEQYDMTIPTIDLNCREMKILYDLYSEVAKALEEEVLRRREFGTKEELEQKLRELQERSERAQECADLYRTMGKNAYICYAWDQELSALGYQVHKRREIEELVQAKPVRAKVGDTPIPFYEWEDGAMTQLYSVASQCDLQVIVHEDGTVSMEAVTDGDKQEASSETEEHICSKMKVLRENLRKKWFLTYDYQERRSAAEIASVQEWLMANGDAWRRGQGAGSSSKEIITDTRKKTDQTSKYMRKDD